MTILTWNGSNFEQRDTDGMVDLTAMAKANGVLIGNWNRASKKYIESTASSMRKRINEIYITKVGSTKNGGGTWAHPLIAIAFAQWISPEFHVWCNQHIKTLIETGSTQVEVQTFTKDEALAEKTEYVKSIFRPHFDKVDRFVKDQCSSIIAELKTAKKIWVSEINPVARLANESDEDFEQRLDRIEILQDLDLPLFEKGEVDGIYIFEHGYDVLWDTWDLPEIFEAKVGGSIDGLNWLLKEGSATIFDLGWNADEIDSAMLSCFGTCLDLGGVVQTACREFDRLQPAKGAIAQLDFDDDSVLDNCVRKCEIIPEFNAYTKKLEALKIPKQLVLSGSVSIKVDTKESLVSRLNFGAKLSELEWYRI
jgi:KilA-N domain